MVYSFDKIMQEQEEKRELVKKNSVAITKIKEEPFSFYYRDQNKKQQLQPEYNSELDKKFKARPIPALLFYSKIWEF